MKPFLAELFGTFFLVLIGTGSIIFSEEAILNIGNFGIAIVFGCTVAMAIFLFGKFSGAHINPAVSLAFFCEKKLSASQLISYLSAQFVGAITASLLLFILFPNSQNLGYTMPSLELGIVFLLEFALTFILMFGIFWIIKKPQRKLIHIALFVGFIVFMEAWLAGPYTGASMNPFRSLAPALFTQHLNTVWLYLIAPITGSLLAWYLNRKFYPAKISTISSRTK